MLLRVILENFFSFKEQTEFNLFPSSRTQQLPGHIVPQGHTKVLRLSAIYGANGAGKSNLIKAMSILRNIVRDGTIETIASSFYSMPFLLNDETKGSPVSIAVEFYREGVIYYYTLSFVRDCIVNEELYISGEKNDELVFSRSNVDGAQKIEFYKGYMEENPANEVFAEALSDKILGKTELLLSFMGDKYSEDIQAISKAYDWFLNDLAIVSPNSMSGITAHQLDKNPDMLQLLNRLLPEMNTGISKIVIRTAILQENDDTLSPGLRRRMQIAKSTPGVAIPTENRFDSRVHATVVYENGECLLKMMQPIHVDILGNERQMPLESESDGTIRLIEYIPFIYSIFNEDKTFLIDEIERSVHPVMIKVIISKISEKESCRGQLIFTTHESCLLDQKILRADEIWLTQKDGNQATQIYPLSDFNIHKTANIEHGYLNGRYGGIPFLSNLKDLNW